MEILLLALLLTMSGTDPERWKRSLSSALKFYRENRELLAMLAQTSSGGAAVKADAPQNTPPQGQEKRQPPVSEAAEEPLGSVLEQFLKNHQI